MCAANGTAERGLSGTDVFRDFTFYFVNDEFPSGAAKKTTKSRQSEDGKLEEADEERRQLLEEAFILEGPFKVVAVLVLPRGNPNIEDKTENGNKFNGSKVV